MKQSFLGKVCMIALLVICSGAQLYAQKVSGVVFDDTNIPIPGASVVIKGTTKGVVTDIDGKFSFSPVDLAKDALIITFIGYEPQEIKINGSTEFNIVMKSSTIEMMMGMVMGKVKDCASLSSVIAAPIAANCDA